MVTLVRAPNPSPLTLDGTNSYLIDDGAGNGLVIDPGPPIARHVVALAAAAAAQGVAIRAIALTHGHPDHAPAAASLREQTGAPIYAHPNSSVERDADLTLDGELRVGKLVLRTIDAPGHTFDHVIFYLPPERALFTGDTILGEGSVVIAPPGGAMRPYQQTLRRLAAAFPGARRIYGGHGPPVAHAQAKIAEYLAHREMRERELIDALARLRRATIPELVLSIYGDARPELWAAMARQLLAHLIALQDEGRVAAARVERPMTQQEAWILNPPLGELLDEAQAALVAAELGAQLRLDTLYAYRLAAP